MLNRQLATRVGACLVLLACSLVLASGASATPGSQLTGAIFTSELPESFGTDYANFPAQTDRANCSTVNSNIYPDKRAVYLNGGPGNGQNNNLPPGTYYVQVTEPSSGGGEVVLGTSVGTANEQPAKVVDGGAEGGLFEYCYQLWSLVSHEGATGYADTGNPGGEYKVYISTEPDFPSDESKTDNFKVFVGGGVPPALDLEASKTANPAFTRTYTWGIEKEVDQHKVLTAGGPATFNYTVSVTHDDGESSGWKVTGEIEVNNPNEAAVEGVEVTDAIDDANATCTVEGGSSATATIPAETAQAFLYECTYSAEPESSPETNTATVKWSTQTLSNGSVLTGSSIQPTAEVNWSTTIPTIVDGSVNVEDPLAPTTVLPATVSYTDESPKEFTYSHDFSGDPAGTCTSHENTATFTTDTSKTKDSASQTVEDCQGADPTVKKTASASFKRTYEWSIGKSVDKTLIRTSGTSATFKYTVPVKETGFQDSEWQVKGKITVENPNDWEAITTDVTDTLDATSNGTCVVTNGTGVSVPAGSSVTRDYTCSYTSAPSPSSGTNTATATWDSDEFSTPDGSAEGTAAYAFGSPTSTVNKTITPTDTFNGGTAVNLCVLQPSAPCTLTATDVKPFTSQTYTYSRIVTIDPNGCKTLDNTATITETGQKASAEVEACPTVTGLTIGYWANKNGQGRITGIAKNGPCTGLAASLRAYAPFQTLKEGATCAEVAAYVYDAIKGGGATCGGSSCNAMLKAQMLATALNVFFAVTNGSEQIDLVNGCKMIDSSSGVATCGGNENWSPAFGPPPPPALPTHLSVLKMLEYAASQSNVGGTSWYAQVKATQVLAKDAFDAINNGVALAY